MKTTLVIMAAGIGSRYGGGIKQLESFGPNGEIIMDYSIHDAMEAGFDRVVFVIRKSLEEDFKEIIGNRIAKLLPVSYVFQEVDDVPAGFDINGRTKPWGTVQALLVCKNEVKEPFVLINADDYYGKDAFRKVHEFLVNGDLNAEPMQACMAGFFLKNTMSDNGGVNRGVCKVDQNNNLVEVVETKELVKQGSNAVGNADGKEVTVDLNSYVSMNFWGFMPNIFSTLEERWLRFLGNWNKEDIKAEYLLPKFVDDMLKEKRMSVKVLETNDSWFGVTYKEDKEIVVEAFRKLIEEGVYETPLEKA